MSRSREIIKFTWLLRSETCSSNLISSSDVQIIPIQYNKNIYLILCEMHVCQNPIALKPSDGLRNREQCEKQRASATGAEVIPQTSRSSSILCRAWCKMW